MLKPEDFKHLSTYLIANEAERRGIKVNTLITKGVYKTKSLLEFQYGGATKYMVGQRVPDTDSVAFWLQKNKYYTKLFLKKRGISVARGEVFSAQDIESIKKYTQEIGYPVVAKKVDGTHGDDVYVNIRSEGDLLNILENFSQNVLIEEMFSGTEYRIFATRDKFVAATNRIPANVTGDGITDIENLIKEKNADPRRSDGYTTGLVTIKIDEDLKNFLAKRNLNLSSVPKEGEKIFLRENSNISTGGDSIDVTDLIHPDIKSLAVEAVKSIPGLAYAGVDFLTKKDITVKPSPDSYVIIELNDSPMISMHHFPYEGKERNAAGVIVDIFFPETKELKA